MELSAACAQHRGRAGAIRLELSVAPELELSAARATGPSWRCPPEAVRRALSTGPSWSCRAVRRARAGTVRRAAPGPSWSYPPRAPLDRPGAIRLELSAALSARGAELALSAAPKLAPSAARAIGPSWRHPPGAVRRALSTGAELELSAGPELELSAASTTGAELEPSAARSAPSRAGAIRRARAGAVRRVRVGAVRQARAGAICHARAGAVRRERHRGRVARPGGVRVRQLQLGPVRARWTAPARARRSALDSSSSGPVAQVRQLQLRPGGARVRKRRLGPEGARRSAPSSVYLGPRRITAAWKGGSRARERAQGALREPLQGFRNSGAAPTAQTRVRASRTHGGPLARARTPAPWPASPRRGRRVSREPGSAGRQAQCSAEGT